MALKRRSMVVAMEIQMCDKVTTKHQYALWNVLAMQYRWGNAYHFQQSYYVCTRCECLSRQFVHSLRFVCVDSFDSENSDAMLPALNCGRNAHPLNVFRFFFFGHQIFGYNREYVQATSIHHIFAFGWNSTCHRTRASCQIATCLVFFNKKNKVFITFHSFCGWIFFFIKYSEKIRSHENCLVFCNQKQVSLIQITIESNYTEQQFERVLYRGAHYVLSLFKLIHLSFHIFVVFVCGKMVKSKIAREKLLRSADKI